MEEAIFFSKERKYVKNYISEDIDDETTNEVKWENR
jgi:hypothetical protein